MDRGVDRTENTVRHHINELRDVGLVDVVCFEEGRGGTTKYYRANTIVLPCSLLDMAADALEEMIDAVQPKITDALTTPIGEYDDAIEEIVQTCSREYCRTQNTRRTCSLTVLRRAFVRADCDS